MTTNGLLNRVTDNNCWLNAAYQGLVTLVDYRILLQGYVQQGYCDEVISNIENIVNFLANGAREQKCDRDFNTMLYQLAKNSVLTFIMRPRILFKTQMISFLNFSNASFIFRLNFFLIAWLGMLLKVVKFQIIYLNMKKP